MREQDAYKDLSDLFRVEDNALAAEPFTGGVMQRVRGARLMRRLIVGGLGLTGAAITVMQLPQLLAGWVGVDKSVTAAIAAAQTEVTTLAMSNPMWTALTAGIALCIGAVTAFERA